MKRIFLFFLISIVSVHCTAQKTGSKTNAPELVFEDNFTALDTSLWIPEIAPLPGSSVYVEDGNLILDTKGGVTVWLNKKLSGDIRIEYTRKVPVNGGANDRLSDFNTFWMASDPRNSDLFTRNGILERYDSLQMYYVGMGGNTNKTTRFRKYQGNGERTLLQEYKDPAHLLEADKLYTIVIEVKGTIVTYSVNGDTWFEYNDPKALKEGYFGFRSTKSRHSIDRIRIYKLN